MAVLLPVQVVRVAPGSAQGTALLRRFEQAEPLLFDCDFSGAAVYGLARGEDFLGLAVVRENESLQTALDTPSCGYSVGLLEAIAVLPEWRGRGLGRVLVRRLLELHPRLVCVAAEGTDGFWSSVMVALGGNRYGSAEVARHLGACPLCGRAP